MLLLDWFPLYVSRQLDLEPTTIKTYRYAVEKLCRWHLDKRGSPLTTENLSVDVVTDWLSHVTREERLKPRSVNSYRSSVNAIWSGAIRDHQAPAFDNRLVPSCRVHKTIPIAWTLDDLRKILEAAKAKHGRRKNQWNTLRRDFWVGLYLFLYDTGTRFGAALSLTPEDVDLRRKLVLLPAENSKTKSDQLVSISEETAEVMSRLIEDGYQRVWPNGVNRQQLYEEHKRTLQKVRLPFDRYHMFHCFRKTTATQIAITTSIEDASRALGHTSIGITRRTYVDARQLPIVNASKLLPRPLHPDDDGERNVIKFSRIG